MCILLLSQSRNPQSRRTKEYKAYGTQKKVQAATFPSLLISPNHFSSAFSTSLVPNLFCWEWDLL